MISATDHWCFWVSLWPYPAGSCAAAGRPIPAGPHVGPRLPLVDRCWATLRYSSLTLIFMNLFIFLTSKMIHLEFNDLNNFLLLLVRQESMLKGRFSPSGQIEGFTAEIGASGSYCPQHVTLPVQVTYYDISEHSAPSPFLVSLCSSVVVYLFKPYPL